ncbi:helix-turn-helix domain-containing protein [uncultured Sphaerochaeta sp.]|uniref:helix-turn-helix domain-containing protein n=1 Tax=uncultured Sphaerochaeta sp. TaxID=886478 RepID=UPI002A0A9CFF|nr:helix-turn-helix domain-containing protein [uncultured Sphaerochaeta sp.]
MFEQLGKLHTKSFFRKLLRDFFVVFAFACLFVLGTNMYSYFDSRDRFLSQNQTQLDTIASTFSLQLQIAFGHGVSLFQESDSIMYFKPEALRDETARSEFWRVQELLRKAESSLSPLVVNEFVYFLQDQMVLGGAGNYDKDFFFSTICNYKDYDLSFWSSNFSKPGRFVLPETILATKSGTVQVLPLVTVIKQYGNIAVHVCNVSVAYLEQIISSSNGFLDEYYICDGDGNLILQNGDGDFATLLNDFTKHKTKSQGSYIFRSQETSSGWTIYSLLSKKNYFSTFGPALWGISFLVFLMLLGGIPLIFYFSKIIYGPIRDVGKILPRTEENTGDELFSIKEGVKQLLDNESIHQQNEYNLQLDSLRHSLLLLLNGIRIKGIEHLGFLLQTQCGFSQSQFVCATVMLVDKEGNPSLDRERQPVEKRLQQALGNEGGCLVVPLETDFLECVFSVDASEQGFDQIVERLKKIQSILLEDTQGPSIFIGVGDPIDTLERLDCSHKQAASALPLLVGQAPFALRCYKELPAKRKVSFSFYDQKGIVSSIETGRQELLERYLLELIDKNVKKEIGSDLMAELYRQILFSGRRVLEDRGETTNSVSQYKQVYDKLKKNLDDSDLQLLVPELVSCLVAIQVLCFPPQQALGSGKIEILKQYICQHYAEPLSLVSIADALNLTPKYISRLFKEETQENLSDYLARLRMEKAKEYLSDYTLKIGEIASLVGIDSRATFLRLFHKYEGVSPKEYRQLTVK